MPRQIIYTKAEAEKVRDANVHLIGKLMYPDTFNDKHEDPVLATIDYLEIVPADHVTMERCFELYKLKKEWISDSVKWSSSIDEFMVWAVCYRGGDLLYAREINELLYYIKKDSQDYTKLN